MRRYGLAVLTRQVASNTSRETSAIDEGPEIPAVVPAFRKRMDGLPRVETTEACREWTAGKEERSAWKVWTATGVAWVSVIALMEERRSLTVSGVAVL